MYRFYLSNFYNTLFQILLVILESFQNFILSIKRRRYFFFLNTFFLSSLFNDSSYCYDSSVSCIVWNLNSTSWIWCWITCMYDLVVSHIDCNMSRIADDISRLCAVIAYCLSAALHGIRVSRKWDSILSETCHDKIRTVSPLRQTVAAVHIRITDILARKGHHITSADICSVCRI